MKKFIITLSFLFTFLLAGNAQVSFADSHHKWKNHQGHDSCSKRDRQHKGIRLFHGHHHHGKNQIRSAHGHHRGKPGEKNSHESK